MNVRARGEVPFFASPSHRCNYLPERSATTVFADPDYPKSIDLYTVLSQHGFRRSGSHIYRPSCGPCKACVPVRVPVRSFRPRRRQRRTLAMNRDLRVSRRSPEYAGEHYALYERYLKSRHAGGGMDNPTPEQYMEFLTSQWSETAFYEFRDRQRLLAVAITDRLVNGLSAVYTFFEPDEPRRSLGVFSVLWQIEEARRIGADWLYLGYLIEESPKMSYKRQYQPQEWFLGDQWVRDRSR